MKETESYYSLIKSWHAKASEDDYFAKFTFEYLAFIAYLRTQWGTGESDIKVLKNNSGKVTDRDFIQALKQDCYLNNFWEDVSLRAPKNKELDKILKELIFILNTEPLILDDERWWNYEGFDINKKVVVRKEKVGVLRSLGDFSNLVEFWYSVKNSLFHGNKSPTIERDKVLVKYAFLSLNFFVENILLVLKETHRMYPAVWEDFWERFKQGRAEINTKSDSSGSCANIYECLFFPQHYYPVLLLDKQLRRSDFVEIVNNELALSGEMSEEIVERLKSVAGNDPKKKAELACFFQENIDHLNKIYVLGLKLD